jgi:hypothetical protein
MTPRTFRSPFRNPARLRKYDPTTTSAITASPAAARNANGCPRIVT